MDPVSQNDDELAKRQAIIDALTAARNPASVNQAKEDAQRTQTVSSIGSALEGLARAQAQSRGGQGVNQGFYKGLQDSSQQAVQDAIAARQQNIGNVMQDLSVKQGFENTDRMNRDLDLKDRNIASEESHRTAQEDRDKQRLELEKQKIQQESSDKSFDKNYKNQELDLRREELGAKNKIADAKGKDQGIIALDKDYAKDYNDFTSGGNEAAKRSIEKLESIYSDVKGDNGTFAAGGGSVVGSLPDALRSNTSIKRRDTAVTAANSALKSTFGGQLSDGERKALANEFYNDKLDNASNAEILRSKIDELKAKLGQQTQKALYFRDKGTLNGFSAKIDNSPVSPDSGKGTVLRPAHEMSPEERDAEIKSLEKELGYGQ